MKSQCWRELLSDSESAVDVHIEEIFEISGEICNLEDLVVQNLTFAYHSHTSTGMCVKVVKLSKDLLI